MVAARAEILDRLPDSKLGGVARDKLERLELEDLGRGFAAGACVVNAVVDDQPLILG